MEKSIPNASSTTNRKSHSTSARDGRERAKEALTRAHKHNSKIKKEFIEFINRGSVIDLAVGVAVGGAFTTIVNSLVNDIVMPIVGLVLGGVDFTNLAIRVPNFFGTSDEAVIAYGNFLQNVVQFLIIAWVIFTLVKVMNKLNRKRDKKEAAAAADVATKSTAKTETKSPAKK